MPEHRRYRPLTAADVAAIPPCSTCGAPGASAQAAWVRGAMRAFGACGFGAYDEGQLVGHLLVATTLHLPPGFPPQLADKEAAVIVGVRVDDDRTRHGMGRGLVQSAASHLPIRHLDAVSRTSGCCVYPPEEWLDACGFRPLRRAGAVTTWRLDVASALRWRRLPATAWERLVGLVPRPGGVVPPEPAGRRAS